MKRRIWLVTAAFFLCAAMMVAWLVSPGEGIPVLTYHHVGEGPDWL